MKHKDRIDDGADLVGMSLEELKALEYPTCGEGRFAIDRLDALAEALRKSDWLNIISIINGLGVEVETN